MLSLFFKTPLRKRNRVLMLLENNSFPQDERVRREANSLVVAGYAVAVIAPRGAGQPFRERLSGVDVIRYPAAPDASGVWAYLFEYGYSTVAIFILTLYVWLRRGFDILHLHNPPDLLFAIAAFYKLLGKRFVFDHHDLWPEMYEARFNRTGNSLVIRILALCERWCCRLADLVIATNESTRQVEILRCGVPEDRIVVVRNGPELRHCEPAIPLASLARCRETVIAYLGVMGRQDGLDYLLRSLRSLIDDFGQRDFRCVLIGTGEALESNRALAKELQLDDHVEFAGFLPESEYVQYLAAADICVDPDPSNPYNDRCTMIKLTDYMASGKPIVAFDLPEHRVTADEACLYARANDEVDFARQIARLIDDASLRQKMGQIGRQRIRSGLSWNHQEEKLLVGYRKLTPTGAASKVIDEHHPAAIVIGIDDVRGVYAARSLARHGVPVIGIAKDPRSYGTRTRACRQIFVADTGNEELIRLLCSLGPEFRRKAILVPCMDMAVVTLSRHRQQLQQWYELALPPAESVELLTDKIKFYEYAAQHELPIPETRFLYSRNDAQRAAHEMTFPCAVKPPNSKSPRWLSRTHLKAFKAQSGKDLVALYDEYGPHAEALIVQRWIEGTDNSHYTCNCYFDADGQPLVKFTSRKIRQWPPATGEGCLSEECRADDIVAATLRVFAGLQYHGLGYVEFKRDAVSGKQLIVEPNIGRPTGRCALIEGSGVELVYTMYCELAGLPLPPNRAQHYRGTKWIFLRRDLMSGLVYWRRGQLSLRQWIASLRGRKVYALFSWTDPIPFLADLCRTARLLVTRSERRKRAFAETVSSSDGDEKLPAPDTTFWQKPTEALK